ncbi:MAG: Nif3-like dinuclear metal center hexameric protein [Helicobacteraceae bacterium]|jgi:dinuclear metal center YbgI/SA1388 family protein|nr:Nif3-like dinuclear metal center hexameric protein [Helicobacteraceae bacterium]
MIVKELLNICDLISPFDTQEVWDNSGLIIGDLDAKISQIYLSLEADKKVIDALPNGAALIAHHPLIFSPLKSLNFAQYPALLIRDLIMKNATLIAMHTNFDKSSLNRFVAREILGWREFSCEGFACFHETRLSFEQIIELAKTAFGGVRSIVQPAKRDRYKIAFCCGSGGGLIGEIECDILIAGDLKYHDAIKARTLGIGVIDAGHYETERFFGEALRLALEEKGINAIIAPSQNPFSDGIR